MFQAISRRDLSARELGPFRQPGQGQRRDDPQITWAAKACDGLPDESKTHQGFAQKSLTPSTRKVKRTSMTILAAFLTSFKASFQ